MTKTYEHFLYIGQRTNASFLLTSFIADFLKIDLRAFIEVDLMDDAGVNNLQRKNFLEQKIATFIHTEGYNQKLDTSKPTLVFLSCEKYAEVSFYEIWITMLHLLFSDVTCILIAEQGVSLGKKGEDTGMMSIDNLFDLYNPIGFVQQKYTFESVKSFEGLVKFIQKNFLHEEVLSLTETKPEITKQGVKSA